MKFGGASVANDDKIRLAATKVMREITNGYNVAVVVSAKAGVTNRLIAECEEQGLNDRDPLYSSHVSEGEVETSRIMAAMLNEMGMGAQAWSGPQTPIRCDNNYGRSRIQSIPTSNIDDAFAHNQIMVVAGFQGISAEGRITTLGRGGSDTTAVALACAMGAERCDIYTDVDGVYTADPRIVKAAQKIENASFEDMLEMAGMGSKVLHARSVELAMKFKMPIQVLSSMNDGIGSDKKGTMIMEECLEGAAVTGIASDKNQAQVTIWNVQNTSGELAKIFNALALANINKDMISQPVAKDGESVDITFTVAPNDLETTVQTLNDIDHSLIETDKDVVKVSAVGVGMASDDTVSAKFFQALGGVNINVSAVTTSEIKISVLVHSDNEAEALTSLHRAFGLDKK